MSKRFHETEIWKEDWFLDLPIIYKMFWYFILCNCNEIGIWKKNTKLIKTFIDPNIDLKKAEDLFDGRIKKINEDIYLIPDFISFQYRCLSLKSRVHGVFIKKIESFGLMKYFKDLIVEESVMTSTKRKRLTLYKKEEIFLRDEFRCQYCSKQFEKLLLTVDHVVPINKDGSNEDDNLVTACISCNSKKSDKDVNAFIKENNMQSTITDRVSKILNTLSNPLHRVKDKDKDKGKYNNTTVYCNPYKDKKKNRYTVYSKKKGQYDPKVSSLINETVKKLRGEK